MRFSTDAAGLPTNARPRRQAARAAADGKRRRHVDAKCPCREASLSKKARANDQALQNPTITSLQDDRAFHNLNEPSARLPDAGIDSQPLVALNMLNETAASMPSVPVSLPAVAVDGQPLHELTEQSARLPEDAGIDRQLTLELPETAASLPSVPVVADGQPLHEQLQTESSASLPEEMTTNAQISSPDTVGKANVQKDIADPVCMLADEELSPTDQMTEQAVREILDWDGVEPEGLAYLTFDADGNEVQREVEGSFDEACLDEHLGLREVEVPYVESQPEDGVIQAQCSEAAADEQEVVEAAIPGADGDSCGVSSPQSQKEKHPMRQPCSAACKKRCTEKIDAACRKSIYDSYWGMKYNDCKQWLFHHVLRSPKKSSSGRQSRRDMTNTYTLIDSEGHPQTVCKTFFLATLGFGPKNDTIISTLMRTTPTSARMATKDQRGGSVKIDR